MSDGNAQAFIELAKESGALQLGSFTLKSGRPSPYFLNCGKLVQAAAAKLLGELYAAEVGKLDCAGNPVLLGLPYKGIPLAALASAALGRGSFAYLRAQEKTHGEGGRLVGSVGPGDTVIVIDDVLTAGTAAGLGLAALEKMRIKPAAMVVAFDRMERFSDEDPRASVEVLADRHGMKIAAIATVKDMLDTVDEEHCQRLQGHLARFGAGKAASDGPGGSSWT